MSNYNLQLQSNNTDLQTVLQTLQTKATGTKLPELTNEGAASDLLSGKQLIGGNGNIVTGNIPTKDASDLTVSGATVTVPSGYYDSQTSKSVAIATQATPSINVDATGKITASATQTAGYVRAGTKSATQQLNTQAAKTITPTTSNQIIAAGTYLTGVQTIKGDSNLKAENIKSGVSIFGIDGTLTEDGGGIDTSDATATADKIFLDETAYVDGEKVTGTFTIDNEISSQDNLIAQLRGALNGKSGNGGVSGGLETYTLTVTIFGHLTDDVHIFCTTLNNGTIGYFAKSFYDELTNESTEENVVIENVICGSPVIVISNMWDSMEIEGLDRLDIGNMGFPDDDVDVGVGLGDPYTWDIYCKQNNRDSNTASITITGTFEEEEF